MKMKNWVDLIFIAVVMTGCGSSGSQAGRPEEKDIRVVTAEVKKEKIDIDLKYSGTIEAFQTIPLTFQTAGTVEKVLVSEGDEVRKGQLLASVDKTDAENMYQITLAKYQQAKDAYDRLKTVYEKGSLTEIKWVEMQTNLEQAESALGISKNNLDKCNLYSPVSGVVGKRNTEPGMSSLSVASAPFEIVDIRRVYVRISVPENEMPAISKGMSARSSVSALNGASFEGVVTNVSQVADKISRTYEARILVKNPDLMLKPGMVCDVNISERTGKEALIIPYESVFRAADGKTYVYTVDPQKHRAVRQPVSTGQYFDSGLEVLSGLSEGQLIVKDGKEKLSDNCLIEL